MQYYTSNIFQQFEKNIDDIHTFILSTDVIGVLIFMKRSFRFSELLNAHQQDNTKHQPLVLDCLLFWGDQKFKIKSVAKWSRMRNACKLF